MNTNTATYEEMNERANLTVKIATQIAEVYKDFTWSQAITTANNLINAFGVTDFNVWRTA